MLTEDNVYLLKTELSLFGVLISVQGLGNLCVLLPPSIVTCKLLSWCVRDKALLGFPLPQHPLC